MISAVVLSPDLAAETDVAHAREIAVRSLVWLVSAVVSGVVRDVVLAAPAALALSDIADQAGCMLVEAASEADRLRQAVAASRGTQVLVLRAGFQPEAALIEEIDLLIRRGPCAAMALILAAPQTILQRLMPDRAPIVGIITTREIALSAKSFAKLARTSRRGQRLRSRAAGLV